MSMCPTPLTLLAKFLVPSLKWLHWFPGQVSLTTADSNSFESAEEYNAQEDSIRAHLHSDM